MLTVQVGRRWPRTLTLKPDEVVDVLLPDDSREKRRASDLAPGVILFGCGVVEKIEEE